VKWEEVVVTKRTKDNGNKSELRNDLHSQKTARSVDTVKIFSS